MNNLAMPFDDERPSVIKELPSAWQKPVGHFWAYYQYLVPTPLPIVVRLKTWMISEGLTIEVLAPVLKRLVRPEAEAEIQFAGQLFAALARGVENALEIARPPKTAKDNPLLANPSHPVPRGGA